MKVKFSKFEACLNIKYIKDINTIFINIMNAQALVVVSRAVFGNH